MGPITASCLSRSPPWGNTMASVYRRILEKDTPLEDETPCGYCRLRLSAVATGRSSFHAEHIIPRRLVPGLAKVPANLVWACSRCNYYKGGDVLGYDSETKRNQRLFNPRKQSWSRHFLDVSDGKMHGRSRAGRSTVHRLKLNCEPSVLRSRARGWAEGWWPAKRGWIP